MKSVATLAVKLANLAEAEGRAFARASVMLLIVLMTLIVAGLIMLAGLVLFLIALYLFLTKAIEPAYALLILGLAMLLVGGLLGLFASLYVQARRGA